MFFGLIPAPSMSKHISRNKGATLKASWKTAHDKLFFWGGGKVQKGHFFLKKMAAPSQNVITLNLYICSYVLVYERWLVLKVWYTAVVVTLRRLWNHTWLLFLHCSTPLRVQHRWPGCLHPYRWYMFHRDLELCIMLLSAY